MNKSETAYSNHLHVLFNAGEIVFFRHEPMSLRVTDNQPGGANAIRYTPDFQVMDADGVTYMDDVKGTGPLDPASLVRIKAAAEAFPMWHFRLVIINRNGTIKEIRPITSPNAETYEP